MTDNNRIPLYYALIGAVLMLMVGMANLSASGFDFTPRVLATPVFIGLLGGYLLGSSRKKWILKSRALAELERELDAKLQLAEGVKAKFDNLSRIVEAIPLPIYLKGKNHQYLLVNSQYEFLAGKQWREIAGATDEDIFPLPVAELFRQQDEQVLASGQPETFEETVPLAVGIVSFQTFKFPLRDSDGNIYAVGGVCTDLTAQKDQEDRLAVEQERLDAVLRHVNQGVIVTDNDRKIVLFNTRAGELIGCEQKSALAQDLETIYQLPNKEALKSGLAGRRQVHLITRSNPDLLVEQNIINLKDRFGQEMGQLVLFQATDARSGLPGDLDPNEQEPAAPEQSPVSQARILLMDDDPLVRRTCKLLLDRGGFHVSTTKDGAEAVRLYSEMQAEGQVPDVVIMDLTVPGGMGGVEATRLILDLDPQAKIMVASGYSHNPVMANYRDYGFIDRVAKPYSSDGLTLAVRRVLENG